MIARLPSVGQPLCWRRDVAAPEFPGYRALWTSSGTAALALALIGALAQRPGRKRVILPGYGCPDLVAAAVFAGAEPVLLDCAGDDPGYDLDALAAACDGRVAAIVAVNFLGIRERIDALAAIARAEGCVLVEDCAQWYPEPAGGAADALLTSFGRGKPVNLLGGGMLLVKEGAALADWRPPALAPMPRLSRAKALVFNSLLQPLPYGLLCRLPGTSIGATAYHRLTELLALDATRLGLLGANVQHHLTRDRSLERVLGEVLGAMPGVTPLPVALAARSGRLLRYPLLCDEGAQCDALLRHWRDLGASGFYPAALPQIPGVAGLIAGKPALPNAERFAMRLLTLPLHEGVPNDFAERLLEAATGDS